MESITTNVSNVSMANIGIFGGEPNWTIRRRLVNVKWTTHTTTRIRGNAKYV